MIGRRAPRGALLAAMSLAAASAILTSAAGAQRGPVESVRPGRKPAARIAADLAPEVRWPDAPYPVAEPASLRPLYIDIPDVIARLGGTFYHAERGPWQTLGPRAGMIEPGDSVPLLYTLVVPALAEAGENTVGIIRFVSHTGGRVVDVPLMVDVVGRANLDVDPVRAMIGARPGDVVSSEWRLTNRGNIDVDTYFSVRAAGGWITEAANGGRVTVPRGGSISVPLDIVVPSDASFGDFAVVASVRDANGNGASATSQVRIARGGGTTTATLPSVLDLGLGASVDDIGAQREALAIGLTTPLPGGVIASARYSKVATDLAPLAGAAFGRLGFGGNTRLLRLSAESWNAEFGNVGQSMDGVAALMLFGEGATATMERDRLAADVVAVRPQNGEGRYVAGTARARFGDAWAGLVAAELSDDVAGGRFARTVAADLALPVAAGTLRVQLGQRESHLASGAAWMMAYAGHAGKTGVSVSTAFAPGGSQAFARPERSHTLDVSRELTSAVSTSLSAWQSADQPNTSRGFVSHGASLQTRWEMNASTLVSVEGRSSEWESRSPLGDLTNGDQSVRLAADGSWNRWQPRVALEVGRLTRRSALASLPTVENQAGRFRARGGLGYLFTSATVRLDLAAERTGTGVGMPGRQLSAELGAERIPLIRNRLFAHAEYSATVLGSSGSVLDAQALGVEWRLPGDFTWMLEGSRNSLYRQSISAASPWVVATRLQRSFGFVGLARLGVVGRVFLDANGNGRFDRGERGLAGVLVDVDGETRTTDRRGRYVGRRDSEVRVEHQSLPEGYLVASSARAGEAGDIAVVPTAPILVRVAVLNPDRIPLGELPMNRFVVSLRDQAGRVWNNTTDTSGVARFDALPLGIYRVDVDASAISEPLGRASGTTSVRVTPDAEARSITISLTPRRVRPMETGISRRRSLDGAPPSPR